MPSGCAAVDLPQRRAARPDDVAEGADEVQGLAADPLRDRAGEHARVVGREVAALGAALVAGPAELRALAADVDRRLPAEGGLRVVVPLDHGADHPAVHAGGLEDVHAWVDDLRVGAVVHAEPVPALAHPQAGRAQAGDGFDDGGGRPVDHRVVPGVVHVEGGVRTVVVVGRADEDLDLTAPGGGQAALHLGADRVGVGAEDHVEVGGQEGHHLPIARSLEGEGPRPHVVVHPVGLGIAVAHRDPTVVPRRDEHARRHRVGRAGEPLAEVGDATVDPREHRAARGPGEDDPSGVRRRRGARQRHRSHQAPEQRGDDREDDQMASVHVVSPGSCDRLRLSTISPMKSELFSNTEVQNDAMFSLQNSKMLKVKLNGSVSARQGSMVAYQGQASFDYQSAGGIGKMLKQKLTGEGVATMSVSGQAEVFFADQSRDVHLIYLEGDAVSINGRSVLAYDTALDVDVHMVSGAGMMSGGLFNTIIRGTGWVAITTQPLDRDDLEVGGDRVLRQPLLLPPLRVEVVEVHLVDVAGVARSQKPRSALA